YMVLAAIIAAIGIILDSEILVVGAMVVGPEFGPIAAVAVALVQRRGALARRSLVALLVGFLVAVVAAYVGTEAILALGLVDSGSHSGDVRPFTGFISHPNAISFLIAYLAGTAGILSLTTSKSSVLIGVLISVTTIPAASNVAVAAAESDWAECGEAAAQLGLNLAALLIAGLVTLGVQRSAFAARGRRRRADATEPS
ncbi:MAG TPA: DUF389 domain-containing protein, partial [Conexibacter sp.]|nr:DUF389 domain-containing protein [Conexibacter sp.]